MTHPKRAITRTALQAMLPLAAALLLASASPAAIESWTDARGRLHFSDDAGSAPASARRSGGSKVRGLETFLDPHHEAGRLGAAFFDNLDYLIDDKGGVIVLEPPR